MLKFLWNAVLWLGMVFILVITILVNTVATLEAALPFTLVGVALIVWGTTLLRE
jgi:hypothetical protein